MPILAVERGNLRGKRFALPQQGTIRVGRETDCQIQVLDALVSRHHCVLRGEKETWVLEDLKSRNHTFVNGKSVTRHRLVPGDLIEVGYSVFSYLESQEDPLIGTTVGGCQLEVRLGRGSMGTVYRARQVSLDRPVALKILATTLADDPDFVGRFTQEARASARLNHPNVVQVYDAGKDDSCNYMAMEYLSGGTLDDILLADGCMPYKQAIDVALDALKALSYAEAQGIVHRDIKPGNLLFSSDGTAKICDLGIALDTSRPSELWEGTTAGTPGYMAPEQVHGSALDHRADIYALGATLYHTIAGYPPFEGGTLREILNKKIKSDPVPLVRRVAGLPPRVSSVVQTMMVRDPDERYSSAEEAASALTEALAAPTTAARRPHPSPASAKPKAAKARVRPVRRKALPAQKPFPAALVGVIAVILLVVVAVIVTRGGRADDRAADKRGSRGRVERRTDRGSGASAVSDPSLLPDTGGGERLPIDTPPEVNREPEVVVELDRAAVKDLAQRIADILKQGDLRAAAIELAAVPPAFRAEEVYGRLETALSKRIEKLIAASRDTVASEVAASEFKTAQATVDALVAKLPDSERQRGEALRTIIERAENARGAGLEALARLEPLVFRDIGRLDFAGVEKRLQEFAALHTTVGEPWSEFQREIAAVRLVWDTLRLALEGAAKTRKTLALTFAPDVLRKGETPAGRFRVSAVQAHRAAFEQLDGAKRRDVRSLLAVDPKLLLDLSAAGTEGSEDVQLESGEAKAALGLLLLARRGLVPSLPLLLSAEVPEGVRKRNEERGPALGALWCAARFAEAKTLFDECQEKEAEPEVWNYVARDTADLLIGWPDGEEREAAVPTLKKLFIDARTQALLSGPVESFFHAKTAKRLRGGLVQLTYDFSSPEQAEDFFPVEETAAESRYLDGKNALDLVGEFRYLRGNPFEEYLGVAGTVVSGNRDAPNVNVALWTWQDDRLSMRIGGFNARDWFDRLQRRVTAEYLVCGMGYFVELNLDRAFGGGRGGGRGGLGGIGRAIRGMGPIYVREPAYVLLGGAHGQDLGWGPSQLLWSEATAKKLKLPLPFTIELKKGVLKWAIKGRRVPFKRLGELERLEETITPQGSISILTNGSPIVLSSFELRSKLRPVWLAKEAARIAQDELKGLLAEPDTDPDADPDADPSVDPDPDPTSASDTSF